MADDVLINKAAATESNLGEFTALLLVDEVA